MVWLFENYLKNHPKINNFLLINLVLLILQLEVIYWFWSGTLDQIKPDFLEKFPFLQKFFQKMSKYEDFTKLKEYQDITS